MRRLNSNLPSLFFARIAASAAALMFMASATLAVAQNVGDKVVVTPENDAYLRSEAMNVGAAPRGCELTVEATQGDWLRVTYEGRRGWLKRSEVVPASNAIDHFTATVRDRRYDYSAYIIRGKLWLQSGEPDIAISDFTEVIDRGYGNSVLAEALVGRGRAKAFKGDHDAAIEDYTKAIEKDKGAWIYSYRGDSWMAKGEFGKAISDYNEAIRYEPRAWRYRIERGLAYAANGDEKKALQDSSEALTLAPQSAAVHNMIAWFRATCPQESARDGAAALTHAKRAVELAEAAHDPKLFWYTDTLAAAFAELGNFDEAVSCQRLAVEAAPEKDKADFGERLARFQKKLPYRDLAFGPAKAASRTDVLPAIELSATVVEEEQPDSVIMRLTSPQLVPAPKP